MFPEWILAILKESGGWGAIVFVLSGVIVVLSEVIRRMYNQANKVYGYRLQERDILNKALTDATATIATLSRVTDERNEVTDELAEAFKEQASDFKMLRDRIDMQYASLKEEVGRNASAQLNAAAVYAKTVDDIRLWLLRTRQDG